MSLISQRIYKKDPFTSLLICDICGFKYIYYGSAKPDPKLECQGCKTFVKRNPRIIKRN